MENCELTLDSILTAIQDVLAELKKISDALGVPQ